MKSYALTLLVCAALAAPTAAVAQDKHNAGDVTEYRFDDDIVPGSLLRPDNTGILIRQAGKNRSLIKVRKQFIPEMLHSVEDI